RYASADELLYDLEHYIYHSGYGPTNETLGRFIRELFGQAPTTTPAKGTTQIQERTDRIYGGPSPADAAAGLPGLHPASPHMRPSGVYHNTAVVIDADGSLLGRFRKMHIPDDPLYYEKFYFAPGDLGFCAWQTRYAKIGVLICWDQWYPEAARLTALQGAEILFYPTAIGWHPGEKSEQGELQHNAWETVQRGHAIANGCYVAVPNRVGHEKLEADGIEFW